MLPTMLLSPSLSSMQVMSRGNLPWLGTLYEQQLSHDCDPDAVFMLTLLR